MATSRLPKTKTELPRPKPYYPPHYDDGGLARFLGCGGIVILFIVFIIFMNLPQ
jgi:hypothetical protein